MSLPVASPPSLVLPPPAADAATTQGLEPSPVSAREDELRAEPAPLVNSQRNAALPATPGRSARALARARDREFVPHNEPRQQSQLEASSARAVHRELTAAAPPARDGVTEAAQPREDIPQRVFGKGARGEAQTASLPSCEAAAAGANQTIDLHSAGRAPDLTRDAFAAVLESGAYFERCEIPGRMALEICAAVQDGKVVGLSVSSQPANAAISACVRSAVAALRFPQSSQLDVTHTRFEPTH